MKLPRYSVWWRVDHEKVIVSFYVTDHPKGDTAVAVFPVDIRYPEEEQRARSATYCNYMNKIVDATEQAYARTALVDILKQTP